MPLFNVVFTTAPTVDKTHNSLNKQIILINQTELKTFFFFPLMLQMSLREPVLI